MKIARLFFNAIRTQIVPTRRVGLRNSPLRGVTNRRLVANTKPLFLLKFNSGQVLTIDTATCFASERSNKNKSLIAGQNESYEESSIIPRFGVRSFSWLGRVLFGLISNPREKVLVLGYSSVFR